MATVYKEITLCRSQTVSFNLDFNFESSTWWAEVEQPGDVPFFVTTYYNNANHASVSGFLLADNPAIVLGTYPIIINVYDSYGGNIIENYLVIINEVADCIEEQELCCTDGVEIRWLGCEGGIKDWIFPGVRKFEVRVGDAVVFKNMSFQKRYAERKDIYSGKSVSTKKITQDQYDFLTEIKYAIQAWEVVRADDYFGGETVTYVPILIDNDSFDTYESRTKIFEFGFSYIMAEETQMQAA